MKCKMLILTFILLAAPTTGLTEVTGGVGSEGSGQFSSSGICLASVAGGDPSITLGLTSSSSIYGGGDVSDTKTGSQSASLAIGGFWLSVSYDGLVQSSLRGLDSGTVTSFVGATATGASTGKDSYDIFGSADISTEGYMSGSGVATATASGMASYDVVKIGTTSEAWGKVEGTSTLRMEGTSYHSFLSTLGSENGLHSDSHVQKTISGTVPGTDSESSYSSLSSYGSVIGPGKTTVSASGTSQGGAWSPGFSGIKTRLVNENVQTYARGDIEGYCEANGALDAADVSALLDSSASKSSGQHISGGPATYASVIQTSAASRTYAECWIADSLQGSVVRETGRASLQWSNLEELRSGAHVYEPSATALSFGNILMEADYIAGAAPKSTGYMKLDTFAEATKGKVALAGSQMLRTGDGSIIFYDGSMRNKATFTDVRQDGTPGGLFHASYVKAWPYPPSASTYGALGRAVVDTNPHASETFERPWEASTILDPNTAWSRTVGLWSNPA